MDLKLPGRPGGHLARRAIELGMETGTRDTYRFAEPATGQVERCLQSPRLYK